MNALSGPAAAGTDDRPLALDRGDWLRLIGGMMFASGAIVLLARKGQDWSDWAIFAALLIPAAVLLGLAFVGRVPVERPGWQGAFLVFGTLLLLGALIQLVIALKGEPRELNLVWTFAVAAAVAVASSFLLRAPFQMLLGALLGAVAWLALWDKILTNPSGETVRWLLIVLAVIYLVGAILLLTQDRPQASDLITVSGFLGVLAAAISFASLAGLAAQTGGALPDNVPKAGQGWNIFLLIVSLLLIGYGSRGRTRGPAYIGAIGLASFIGLTGSDLVNRFEGEGGGVVGWPLILLIGGGVILVLGFLLRPDQLGGGGGAGPAGPGGPGLQAQPQPGAPDYAQPPTQAGYPQQPTQAGYPQQTPPPPPDPGATRAHQQPPPS
jgi:CDP-diglyceride synthetase